MSGINQHSVLGRIGKIETRYTQDGKPIVNMSLAVSENWTDKNSGQKQEKTEWIRVTVFGKPAEIIGQYANKGDKIYIQGKVVTRKYTDNAGIEKYTTETVVDGFNGKFELLGTKPSQETQNQTRQPAKQSRPAPPPNQPQGAFQQTNGGNADGFDTDIPFVQHERFML